MASWIDALASRSGPLQTAATHFTATHGLECDPPRGVIGLSTLSSLIARAQRCEADEQAFVEGAGAYLGLLLLDHLPAAAHTADAGEHRLRVGQHGFFDPFAAVADALDAGDARRALLRAVRTAEAEAAGVGPTARVVNAVLERLRRQAEARVLRHFDHKLWLEIDGVSVELDLTRVIEVTEGEPDSVLEYAVARLCASLTYQPAPLLTWDSARGQLFPRLVGPAFVSSLPNREDLHLLQLGPEVWVTLVLRYRERARYVRQVEVDTWSKDGAAPRTQALQNLAGSCQRARFLQHVTQHGPLVVAESRDGLDASRLLLPGLYEVLAPTLGTAFLAATPHRDTLLAGPLNPGALVEELQARTFAAWQSAPHAIASGLWLVTGPGKIAPFTAGVASAT